MLERIVLRLSRWPAGRKILAWSGLLIVAPVLAASLYAVIWLLPDKIAMHDVGATTAAGHASALQTARDAARGRLVALGAGLFAAGALVYTARNYALSRQGQVTDRYAKAIEQVGSKELNVRIGGIYALERIARDSSRDYPTIMEILAEFIRDHPREPWPPAELGAEPQKKTTHPDVQVAATVIGRRKIRYRRSPIILGAADLPGAKLSGADFSGVNLAGANLADADLAGADLTGADLTGADLTGAKLGGAFLGGASLRGADLTGMFFPGAFLPRADLTGAKLTGAIFSGTGPLPDLTGADLKGAGLTGAKLTGAKLSRAKLDRVDLSGADLQGARFARAALTGAKLAHADLKSAKFSRANLTDADLQGADLAFADLKGANLTRANLTGANLGYALWPTDAPIPAGWQRYADNTGRRFRGRLDRSEPAG